MSDVNYRAERATKPVEPQREEILQRNTAGFSSTDE